MTRVTRSSTPPPGPPPPGPPPSAAVRREQVTVELLTAVTSLVEKLNDVLDIVIEQERS